MTTRMTKQLREQICANVIAASKWPKELESIKAAIADTIHACYLSVQPEGFLEKIKGLPKSWFVSHKSHYCMYTAQSYDYAPDGKVNKTYSVSWSEYDLAGNVEFPEVLLPYKVVVPSVIAKAIHETTIPARNAKRIKGLEKLREQTMGLLQAFNTVEKLLKEAPEMKKFIPKAAVAYPVPVIPVSNALTAMLEAGVMLEEEPA